jgi:hypothetical protein
VLSALFPSFHRDLKVDNLLLDANLDLKLIGKLNALF